VTKRLTLQRERLAELATDDLRMVVGGQSGLTCPVAVCVRDLTDQLGCVGTDNCLTYDC